MNEQELETLQQMVYQKQFNKMTVEQWKVVIWSLLRDDDRKAPAFYKQLPTVHVGTSFSDRDSGPVVMFALWVEHSLTYHDKALVSEALSQLVLEWYSRPDLSKYDHEPLMELLGFAHQISGLLPLSVAGTLVFDYELPTEVRITTAYLLARLPTGQSLSLQEWRKLAKDDARRDPSWTTVLITAFNTHSHSTNDVTGLLSCLRKEDKETAYQPALVYALEEFLKDLAMAVNWGESFVRDFGRPPVWLRQLITDIVSDDMAPEFNRWPEQKRMVLKAMSA